MIKRAFIHIKQTVLGDIHNILYKFDKPTNNLK